MDSSVKKNSDNIIPFINLIMCNIPDEITDLEKIRYIYIELGKVFSYDYRIISDESVASEPLDYERNMIGRYKTCYQISDIFTLLVNNFVPNAKAKIIERTIPGRHFSKEHVATEVEMPNHDKFLFDLTLDLYNIQAGLRTEHFGFETDSVSQYDIISQKECKEMDRKLGFVQSGYTNDDIDRVKSELSQVDFSGKTPKEIIEYKITYCKEKLSKNFVGCHEGSRYIYKVLTEVLEPEELRSLKQYNLSYSNTDSINLVSVYGFSDVNLFYLYTGAACLNKTTPKNIYQLLKNGWKTNSVSIQSIFEDLTEEDKISQDSDFPFSLSGENSNSIKKL